MICKACGADFKQRNKRHFYCSEQCRPSVKRKPTLIIMRDRCKCFYCGRSAFADHIMLEVDHLRPISSGGLPLASNLVTACKSCNASKRDMLIMPPLLTEMLTEIAKRNLAFGIPQDMEFSMGEWYLEESEKRKRRKNYDRVLSEYQETQTTQPEPQTEA